MLTLTQCQGIECVVHSQKECECARSKDPFDEKLNILGSEHNDKSIKSSNAYIFTNDH